jgi:hypothetical protein
MPPGLYFFRLGVVAPNENRLLGEFAMPGEASRLVVAPGPVPVDPAAMTIARPVGQEIAPAITLLGYTPPEQVLSPQAPTWLSLYWQATGRPADYLVRLRLLDQAGQEAARWQDRPGYGRYATADWRPGEIIHDVWALQTPAGTPVGRYQLELSLVNPAGEAVAPAVDLGAIEVWLQPISYETPPMQAKVGATFGDKLTLLGYDLYFDVETSNTGKLTPVFYWQSRSDLAAAFDLRLALRAMSTDQVVKEWQVPLGSSEAKAAWKAGEVVTTIYQLEAGTVTGDGYHLDVTVVNLSTGLAEPVAQAEGSAGEFVRIENIEDKIVVRTAVE